jgi:Tfp pilus assembly protein PilV
MVSMALIATALLAIMQLLAQSLDLQSEAGFITAARLLAQERIAGIAANPEELREGSAEGGFGEDHPGFRYTQEISRTGSNGELYRVSLTVFMDEEKTLQRSFPVETLLYRRPQ